VLLLLVVGFVIRSLTDQSNSSAPVESLH
jgi:hypothetical protein